jgi:hypothetical protein
MYGTMYLSGWHVTITSLIATFLQSFLVNFYRCPLHPFIMEDSFGVWTKQAFPGQNVDIYQLNQFLVFVQSQ